MSKVSLLPLVAFSLSQFVAVCILRTAAAGIKCQRTCFWRGGGEKEIPRYHDKYLIYSNVSRKRFDRRCNSRRLINGNFDVTELFMFPVLAGFYTRSSSQSLFYTQIGDTFIQSFALQGSILQLTATRLQKQKAHVTKLMNDALS